MSYAKRLMLAEAQRALEDAEAAEAFDKDPRRCLAEGPDGNQCRGYRIKDELYCMGHKRSAKRKHFAYAHEEFTEALPVSGDGSSASAANRTEASE